MIIRVGSANQNKIEAVRSTLKLYEIFKDAEVIGVKAYSGVADQPKTLEETIRGAKNRAKEAFGDCTYSFGIESGVMEVPYTKTGYMDFTSCVIYDGTNFYIGLSPALETPQRVMRYIFEQGMNFNDAFYEAGLTSNKTLGEAEGFVGLLTKNRLTRKSYTQQAIICAMVHLENDMN